MKNNELLNSIKHSHHQPEAVCVACTANALSETLYYIIDNQDHIENIHLKHYGHYLKYSEKWFYSAMIGISDSSLDYIINHLLTTSIPEFEAFLSIARNMLERLSKLQFIIYHPEEEDKASNDLKKTDNDIRSLFECSDPEEIAKFMKSMKFLDKGISLSHIKDQKYQLLFSYLSRVIHTYNLDAHLSPKYDRFFIKSYILVVLFELYNDVLSQCLSLDNNARKLHKSSLMSIRKFWVSKGVTPEELIYCTSYYNNDHTENEANFLNQYLKALDKSFSLFKNNHAITVPVAKIQ